MSVLHYVPNMMNPFSAQSFHSKSLFMETKEKEYLGFIGSSNFAQRSYSRDNEMNFYVFSKNKKLKNIFEKEKEFVLEDAKDIDSSKDKRGVAKRAIDKLFWAFCRWAKIC